MSRRISGMNFDVELLGAMIHVEKATLTINDSTAVTQTRGITDGYVDGDVTADVEYELDTKNFNLLSQAARSAGSWRGIEPHDVLYYANTGTDELKVEAFGVKLLLSDLLDIDTKGGDKSIHKIKGFITSPDFVRINGVPYLSRDDTRHLIG
ncbi:phage protein [Oceanisphaera psychrotolerans]|uniref:Phage tail protein n=1 Tax=Oceanisphaera psychrotolerans TaxID=1414654 RepID=A0A1J4QF79_9GAMM|nr:phage protein [Oceanisphaera psychrotolerans]OIN09082.1 phage tail protein [Oceanisphaera psychrotolerans]